MRCLTCIALLAVAIGGCANMAKTQDPRYACPLAFNTPDSVLPVLVERQLIKPEHVADIKEHTIRRGFNKCEVLAARGNDYTERTYTSGNTETTIILLNPYGPAPHSSVTLENDHVVGWSQ